MKNIIVIAFALLFVGCAVRAPKGYSHSDFVRNHSIVVIDSTNEIENPAKLGTFMKSYDTLVVVITEDELTNKTDYKIKHK